MNKVDIEVNEIIAILEYAKNKLLVSASDSIWRGMFIIENFSLLRIIDEPSLQNYNTYWLEKIPGFDLETYPFVISQGSPTFNLINVITGSNEVLIKDKTRHYYG